MDAHDDVMGSHSLCNTVADVIVQPPSINGTEAPNETLVVLRVNIVSVAGVAGTVAGVIINVDALTGDSNSPFRLVLDALIAAAAVVDKDDMLACHGAVIAYTNTRMTRFGTLCTRTPVDRAHVMVV